MRKKTVGSSVLDDRIDLGDQSGWAGQYTATRWLERRIVFEEVGFGAAKSKVEIACTILKRVARQVIGARVV